MGKSGHRRGISHGMGFPTSGSNCRPLSWAICFVRGAVEKDISMGRRRRRRRRVTDGDLRVNPVVKTFIGLFWVF